MFRRRRDGHFEVGLGAEERELLRTLPGQLRELLDQGDGADPALRRLFPPAYVADEEHEAEYRRLMGGDLREHHLQALSIMEATVDAERLAEDELVAWLLALNDVRLVLGTRLDVAEDMDWDDVAPEDPRAPGLALYGYLSMLVEQVVEALASSLPG